VPDRRQYVAEQQPRQRGAYRRGRR
jgi:hypothetical protein